MSSQGLINKSTLNNIATAINTRLGETDAMKPSEMADKINGIPNGLLIDSMEDLWRNASLDSGSKYLDYNELSTTGREVFLPTSDPQITGGAPYPYKYTDRPTVRLMQDNFNHYQISVYIDYNNGLYNTVTVTLYNSDGQSTSATVSINNPNKVRSISTGGSVGLVNTYVVTAEDNNELNHANLVIFIEEPYSWGDDLDEYLTVQLVPTDTKWEMGFHYPLNPDRYPNPRYIMGCSYKKSGGHYLIGIHTGTSAKTLDFTLSSGIHYNVTIRDSQSSDYEDCSYFVEPYDYFRQECYYGCCLDEMFLINSETDLNTPLTSLSTSVRKRSQVKYHWAQGFIIDGVSRSWAIDNSFESYMCYQDVNTSTGEQTTTYLYDPNNNIGEPCIYDIETLEAVDEIHGWVYNSSTQKYEKDGASISLMGVMSDELIMVSRENRINPVSYDEDLDCFIVYDSLYIIGHRGYGFYIINNKVLSPPSSGIVFRDGVPDFSIGLQSLNTFQHEGCYLDITLKGE